MQATSIVLQPVPARPLPTQEAYIGVNAQFHIRAGRVTYTAAGNVSRQLSHRRGRKGCDSGDCREAHCACCYRFVMTRHRRRSELGVMRIDTDAIEAIDKI